MPARTSTRQVLLIENHSAVNERVLAVLADRACHVTSVALREDGHDPGRRPPPDLLVLDLLLPDMPGAEVVRRVRALDGLALVQGCSSPRRLRPGSSRILGDPGVRDVADPAGRRGRPFASGRQAPGIPASTDQLLAGTA